MTLLEYALKLVDDKLADLKTVEDRLITLNAVMTTPDLQADIRRLTIEYADMRYRLLQQKDALLHEAAAYHAERQSVGPVVH
jgi:hypothetical protein